MCIWINTGGIGADISIDGYGFVGSFFRAHDNGTKDVVISLRLQKDRKYNLPTVAWLCRASGAAIDAKRTFAITTCCLDILAWIKCDRRSALTIDFIKPSCRPLVHLVEIVIPEYQYSANGLRGR